MIAIATVMYGTNPLYELELFGSVLSALSFGDQDDIEVTVFTDRQLDDFPLPIKVEIFDKDEWDEWTFGGNATHLVKMHIMCTMLRNYQCPVLYFDTDVIFLRSPVELANTITETRTLMHAHEGPISSHPTWANLVKHTKDNAAAFSYPITAELPMYNSGVMGMLPAHEQTMQQAIDLATELYHFEPIFSIDQFSTGTMLSTVSTVGTCEAEVFHYWGWRRKFVHMALESIRENWLQSTTKQRPDFESLAHQPSIHLVDRLAAKLVYSLRRRNGDSRFAYLAFLSAKRFASNNIACSQAWLTTCLDFIHSMLNNSYSNTRLAYSARDFSYLFKLAHNPPKWLKSDHLNKIQSIEKALMTQQ